MLQFDSLAVGYFICQCYQFGIVRFVHIREARACGEVLAAKRMLREAVDVVGDDHDVANVEFRVHTARCVAYKKHFYAQFIHHAYGECYILHGVSFIEMEASLHGDDVLVAEFAENQFSAMSFDCRDREIGDVGIVEFVAVSYL